MTTSVETIDLSQAKRAMAICMKAQITPVLISSPGAGKTTCILDFIQNLRDNGISARERFLILSQCDISDFSLPKEVDGRVVQCPAAWIPLKRDEKPDDPFTFIILDELDRCGPDIQNISVNLILGRNIAGEDISSKVMFFAAMNSSSDIYTTALSKAMINRVCMLYIKSSYDSYEKWANDNGISQARIAFQKFQGEEMIAQNDEPFEDVSIPTNRSLDAVDRVMDLIDNNKVTFKTDDIIKAVTAGLIGVPAAIEYRHFLKMYKTLPSPDEVLANPRGFDSGSLEASQVFALMNSVVNYAAKDLEDCEKAFQFLSTLGEEFKRAGMNTLIHKNPDSVTCPTYMRLING